jgi:hypothetical protein
MELSRLYNVWSKIYFKNYKANLFVITGYYK